MKIDGSHEADPNALVAENLAKLLADGARHTIDRDPNGSDDNELGRVWTGTGSDGVELGENAEQPCDNPGRLYCFEE